MRNVLACFTVDHSEWDTLDSPCSLNTPNNQRGFELGKRGESVSGSTSFPNPSRVRLNTVNSILTVTGRSQRVGAGLRAQTVSNTLAQSSIMVSQPGVICTTTSS